MKLKELAGKYAVIGSNQNIEANRYQGTLNLTINANNSIEAKWLINNTEEQFGQGFFKDNTLVINFNYVIENMIFKGVVVYKYLSKDIMEGFWSEKHGDPNCIGKETCFRISESKTYVN